MRTNIKRYTGVEYVRATERAIKHWQRGILQRAGRSV